MYYIELVERKRIVRRREGRRREERRGEERRGEERKGGVLDPMVQEIDVYREPRIYLSYEVI